MLPHGGLGAMKSSDGKYPSAYPHNSIVTPSEIIESKCPVKVVSKEIIVDSCGPGKYRGGPGQKIVFKNIGKNTITLTIRPDMIKYPARGLSGGGDGINGSVILNNNEIFDFKPIEWKSGEEVSLIVPSGGGYGDPKNRSEKDIINDLINGLYNVETANMIYKKNYHKNDIENMKINNISRILNNENTI